jgi:hypothetical protein
VGSAAERGRELRRFQFTGIGFKTLGDAWLAESGAAWMREQRRIAREELRAASSGALLAGQVQPSRRSR